MMLESFDYEGPVGSSRGEADLSGKGSSAMDFLLHSKQMEPEPFLVLCS